MLNDKLDERINEMSTGEMHMEENKELTKKDLLTIVKLDAQLDYSKKDTVKKYYMQIIQHDLLTTSIGKKYKRRLQQIVDDETDNNQCLFCSGEAKGNTVICPACAAKIKQPTQPQQSKTSAPVYCRSCGKKMNAESTICPSCKKEKNEGYKYCAHCGKEVPMPNWESLTNDVKNKSKVFADQAAKIAKENVQNIAKQGEKIMGDITAGADVSKKGKVINKRNIIILAIVLLVAAAIVKTVGLASVFGFLALVSFAYLVYKIVKKEPKKKAVIALAVCLVLSGAAGMSSGGLSDDVLDYLGTKESVVYRTYDKDSFKPIEYINRDFLTNEDSLTNGLPYIELDESNPRRVCSITLRSGMNASLNVKGLHVGDNVDQMVKCMGTNTTKDEFMGIASYRYEFQYHGKNVTVQVFIKQNVINSIICSQ